MACVASLAVAAPCVSRARVSRRAPAPAPAASALGPRVQRVAPRRVAAAALGNKDDGVKLTRDKEPEEARTRAASPPWDALKCRFPVPRATALRPGAEAAPRLRP